MFLSVSDMWYDALIPRLSLCLCPPLSKWAEYILFASLLMAVCIIFSIMAYFYTYIDPAEIEAQFKTKVHEDDEDEKKQLQKAEIEMVKKSSIKSHDEDDAVKQTKMWTVQKADQISTMCFYLMFNIDTR